jgi:putative membrane protein
VNINTLAQVVEVAQVRSGLWVDHIVAAIIYSALGILVLLITLYGIVKFSPMPIKKEIEEDQNVAVGIVIGSVMLGISIIIAAAILG